MNQTNPRRRPGIVVKSIGGETLLYHVERKTIHVLNPTARCIWDLCDGGHAVDDIARAIRARFAVAGEADLAGDIQQTLDVFAGNGLLQIQQ
ncbi:MAG: PqqD family protein [Anaerolineae bacterium]